MTPLADAEARSRIQNDLGTTLVVEAAAGTGKTTALVSRIVSVVRSGATTLDRVVAVTFTEKAAGEMKLRLRAELEKARDAAAVAEQRSSLEAALAALEVAHINTIHGFCADILRERPVQAGIDPAFRMLDDAGSAKLLSEAFSPWFEQTLMHPPEGVRRILRRRSWRSEGLTPREQLLRACSDLIDHRDFDAAWSEPEFDRERAIDTFIQRLRALGALERQARSERDYLARALRMFQAWVDRLDAQERTRARDYDGLEAELTRFAREFEKAFTWQGSGKLFGQSLDRQAVLDEREAARAHLDQLLQQAEADLAARLRRELAPVLAASEALKQKRGALDFVDLLLCTRDLLKNDASVRRELQRRFTHLFVDEFQDTDPLQAEILMLLAADDENVTDYREARATPGKLFVVGDPKQSIYRFRRADVVFYDRMKRALLAGGAALLHLTTNFRSVPSVQAAVNAAFAHWMTGEADGSQAEYVPLTPYRAEIEKQPGVIALPVPEPYGRSGRLTKKAVNESYPEAVGAFVKWLLDSSGWQVLEGKSLVPVNARHVCLLFRRFQSFGEDLTHAYVRALEARRIPHVLVGGRSFHGREEIMALRAALEAIEWPDDELCVYATLRGPLFGIADEEILQFRGDFGHLRPLQQFDDAARRAHAAVTDALSVLRALHVARNRRPFADTVEQLLSETRAHAALAMWPTGEQALANALSIIDLAHTIENRGATSFRAFLDALAEQADRGERSEAPIIEEGAEGVRLMTVHKAKGLEFPIVICCDPTAPAKPHRGTRYVDLERRLWAEALCGCRPLELLENEALVCKHEEAELVRLTYVAATRARELLVVPTFGDGTRESPGLGWMDTLAPALYPAPAARRTRRAVPGCPTFAEDSVLTRPAEVQARPDECVVPGLHRGASADNPVVWWDPARLELKVDSLGGVRQQELLAAPAEPDGGVDAHQRWQERRRATLSGASRASAPAARVTDLSQTLASGLRVPVERTEAVRTGRPRGARFGTLVHAVLADVPLDANLETVRSLTHVRARLVGGTDDEERAAVDAVMAALAHPLIQRARSSTDLRREVPIVHRRADGILAEGVIDLAFRESEAWCIVDYKTDEVVQGDGAYAAQLALYADAVEAATGEPARGVLLMV